MVFDLRLFLRAFPQLVSGLWLAVPLAVGATAISVIAGLVLALLGLSRWRLARWGVAGYTEFLRNTPLLVQMFFIFFGLPFLGLRFSPFTSAWVALSLQHSAFFSEIYRGGLTAVSQRSSEAAKAIGLTYPQSLRFVILPQALVKVLPAMTNQVVQIIKDTSVASTIAVAELTLRARVLAERGAATFEVFLAVALYYLFLTTLVTVALRLWEGRLRFAE